MFRNRMARYEVLSDDAMATIERGWRRLLQDIGIAFHHPEALRLFREAGQTVEGDVVKLDPDFVLELVAGAPSEFTLRARNPARSFEVGGDVMNFIPVQGPPFVREGDVRREGTLDDFRRFCEARAGVRRLRHRRQPRRASRTTCRSTRAISTCSSRC